MTCIAVPNFEARCNGRGRTGVQTSYSVVFTPWLVLVVRSHTLI